MRHWTSRQSLLHGGRGVRRQRCSWSGAARPKQDERLGEKDENADINHRLDVLQNLYLPPLKDDEVEMSHPSHVCDATAIAGMFARGPAPSVS
jgi:hypothetical protein